MLQILHEAHQYLLPLKTNCLTPISGHLEQNYFVADSHESCTYITPPPEGDLYHKMED
jgi:hypothetical protein